MILASISLIDWMCGLWFLAVGYLYGRDRW